MLRWKGNAVPYTGRRQFPQLLRLAPRQDWNWHIYWEEYTFVARSYGKGLVLGYSEWDASYKISLHLSQFAQTDKERDALGAMIVPLAEALEFLRMVQDG